MEAGMNMKTRLFTFLALAGLAVAQTGDPKKSPVSNALPANMESGHNPSTAAKVKLGRMLYYEPRLSLANDVSCNSCHDLASYGVDGKPTSSGHKRQLGGRNSPTVYNAAGHLAQFWDGRASDVEEQAKGPVLNPVEMAMPSRAEVEWRLERIPGYVAAFKEAFPDEAKPVTFNNMALAIGAFERGLVTPSRWDRFVKGGGGLTPQELNGNKLFMSSGCASCHNGPYLGGASFQKVGVMNVWPSQTDAGRIAVTHLDKDKMVFKVPSLRNIEKTGPYFHDGKTGKLEDAVRMMGKYQLNLQLSDTQVSDIVAFLKTLTGEIPKAYIEKPELPR
jgi:cytochrome c peroxidase